MTNFNEEEKMAPETENDLPKIDEQPSTPDTVSFQIKKYHLITVLVAVLSFGGGYFTHSLTAAQASLLMNNNTDNPAVEAATDTRAASSSQAQPMFSFTDDDPALGPEDAPITIVEFSDYECPYCKRWHSQTFKQLLNMYEGKIRFVYRDFPLNSIHPRAQIAAEAAECADDQGMYWAMHDILFNDQDGWSKASNPLDRFKIYALQLNMDADEFLNCIDLGYYTQEVQFDLRAGASYGITGTPAFLINGKLLSGAHPLETFQMVLDRELAAIEEAAANE